MSSGGVALSSFIGYLPWTDASLIYSLTCFIFFILECFIPESPAWLFKTGREDACTQNLRGLGRSEALIRLELDALKLSTKDIEAKLDLRTFLKPTVWKPFVIMSAFFFLQSTSGVYDVIYYAVDFFERLGTHYDPLAFSTILSVTRFVSTATVGIYFRVKFSRKLTLVFSAFGMTVAFVGAGIYEFMYRNTGVSWRLYQWVPVAFVILYMATGVTGMLGLPWAMTGEVYPLKVRGTMTSVTYFIGFSAMFVSVKVYYTLLDLFQIDGLLFLYAAFAFLAVLLGAFILPETNNKSLFEIEQSFLPKKAGKESADSQKNSAKNAEYDRD